MVPLALANLRAIRVRTVIWVCKLVWNNVFLDDENDERSGWEAFIGFWSEFVCDESSKTVDGSVEIVKDGDENGMERKKEFGDWVEGDIELWRES